MITDLIPQREPILMVDDAQPMGSQSVKTSLQVRTTNWFYADGVLLEAGLVEHIAQSAAALVGLQTQGAPRVGYIGDVKEFIVHRLPNEGETIETTVSIKAQLENITLVEAISCVENTEIAQARMKVVIAE